MQPEPPPAPGPPPAPPPGPPPGPPLEEPPPDRHLWPWLLALAIVVIAGIAALVVVKTHDDKKPTVTVAATRPVPSVVTLPKDVAVRRLTNAGFDVQIRFAPSSRPKGMVVAQAPEGGARLSRGATVALTVSAGKPKVATPDVVGLTVAAAVKRLQRAGLKSSQRVIFAPAPAGRVVSQRPAAGTPVTKGSKIALSVSKGPQRVTVPNVVGRRRDDAVKRLRQAGLHPAVFSVPSQEPRGFVVAQSPRSGTKAPKGSRVRLNVSQGAPAAGTTSARARVPTVVGLSQAAATADLQAAGFRVSVVDQPTRDENEDGVVLDEDPPAETRAPAGSLVTIYVGRITG